MEWILDRDEHGLAAWINDPAKVTAYQQYIAERPPQPLTPGEQAQEDAFKHIAALREKLDELRRTELETYASTLSTAIAARLHALDLNVPIHVTVTVAPNDADLRNGTTPLPGESDSQIDEPIAAAIAATPGPAALPGTPVERAEAALQREQDGEPADG